MRRLVSDTLIIAERNLIRLPRAPELLLAFTVQPIMFVLLFRYVFGGAISTPGFSYVDFLIPGIIVQNIAFGGFVTAHRPQRGHAQGADRPLPLAADGAPGGARRAHARDIVTNALSMAILLITGVIIGFSFHTSLLRSDRGRRGCCCCSATRSRGSSRSSACSSPSPEAANSVGFIAVFPLTFISSAFVPVSSMPEPLKAFAEVNPFTIVVDALRHLWLGAPDSTSVWGAVAWSLAIVVVFAPLAVARYRRAAGR